MTVQSPRAIHPPGLNQLGSGERLSDSAAEVFYLWGVPAYFCIECTALADYIWVHTQTCLSFHFCPRQKMDGLGAAAVQERL